MFLLVDPQTQLHDVTQVELNFLRYEEPQEFGSKPGALNPVLLFILMGQLRSPDF